MSGRVRSFRAAWAGLMHAARTQRNFQIELGAAALALALTWWLGAQPWPIVLAIALVLGLELVNTALEAVVDLTSPNRNDSARVAKDCAAAAVLVAALGSMIVGVAVLGPPLLARLAGGGT